MRYSRVGLLSLLAASVLILLAGVGESSGQSSDDGTGLSNVSVSAGSQPRIEPPEAKRSDVVTVQGLTGVPDAIWLCPATGPIDTRQPMLHLRPVGHHSFLNSDQCSLRGPFSCQPGRCSASRAL